MKGKRNKKEPLTDEEKSRAADFRLKRLISRSAIELVSKDSETQRQVVSQIYGYHLPDEVEKSEKRIVTLIDDLAIKMLKEDHRLARKMAEARLRRLTEKMGLQIEDEEWLKKPKSLDDMIEDVNKYRSLKEAFGVKEPGWLDAITDPKVIIAALQLVSEYIGNKQASPANNVVLVTEDGEEREITRQEYEQLKAGGNTANPKGMEKGEPITPGSGSDTTPGPGTSAETKGKDGATGGAGSDN